MNERFIFCLLSSFWKSSSKNKFSICPNCFSLLFFWSLTCCSLRFVFFFSLSQIEWTCFSFMQRVLSFNRTRNFYRFHFYSTLKANQVFDWKLIRHSTTTTTTEIETKKHSNSENWNKKNKPNRSIYSLVMLTCLH